VLLRQGEAKKQKVILQTATVTGPVSVYAKQAPVEGSSKSTVYEVQCQKMVLDRTKLPAVLTLTGDVRLTVKENSDSGGGSTKLKSAVFKLNEKGEVIWISMEAPS
jgi:hypothetical protein